MVFTLNCASAMVVIPLLWKHGGADIQTRWCWRSSMVVVTLELGGGDIKVAHQSPGSSSPVEPVNNFPRI